MRHALVIARRELAEKRFVALAAVGFAVLPFLLVMIPGLTSTAGPRDVIVVVAGLLSVGFTIAVALALGANVIGRDLAESRLSFYFSRPIGAASIWFGKVAAALLLIVMSFAVIILPARVVGETKWRGVWSGNADSLALAVLGIAVVLFFVAHVLGSFVRSRSAWIAFDFAALCAAGVVAELILRPLIEVDAAKATQRLAIAIGCGVAVALIGGGAWQLHRGRTDRKRSHLALSQFIWIVTGATLTVAGAFVAWMASATPNDLVTINADMPGTGSWAIVAGEARGRMDYRPLFLYNVDTGAYNRLSGGRMWRVHFAPDGKTLLIGRGDVRHGSVEIFRRPVDATNEEATGLTLHLRSEYTTNDRGDRIAAVDEGTLTVYDVPQKRSLGSVRMPDNGGEIVGMYFASPAIVRMFTVNSRRPEPKAIPRTLRIYEFDLARRALQQTGEFSAETRYLAISANDDGSRILARDVDRAVYVLDGRTAALQATLAAPDLRGASFLHDGGLAITRREGDHLVIDVSDRSGAPLRSLPIPALRAWGAREMRDGRLMMLTQTSDRPDTPVWQTLVIDPSSGAIVQRVPGAPVGQRSDFSWWDHDPRRQRIDLPRIYQDAKGRLFRWNFATNKAEVLLPKS